MTQTPQPYESVANPGQQAPTPSYAPPGGYQAPPSAPVHGSPVFVMRPAEPKGLSITSMILGIASFLFGWTFLVPVLGLVFGIIGLRKEPAGKGFAWTGIALSGLMLLGWLVLILTVGISVLGIVGTAALAS